MSSIDKDFVAINIKENSSRSYPPSSKLYCNLCSCNLILLDPQKEEWFCNRCHVSYFPNKGQKVRRANKFTTPGDEKDKIPAVYMIDDSAATYSRPTKSTFPRSFEHLKRTGVNITDFNSTVDNEGID